MKLLSTFLLTILTSGLVLAAPPQAFRADRYKDLYLRSAFTDPPPQIEPDVIPSDLPDWVLTGITKFVDKVEVDVMNMKDRSRVTIPSKEATELGFKIMDVKQDRNYFEHSVVMLKKGNAEGEVRFDKKFLVLKKVAGPPVSKGKRPTGAQSKTGTTNSKKAPPTPPGARGTSTKSSPPKPGAVPKPGATTPNSKPSSSSTKSKRTRYVPRPKK